MPGINKQKAFTLIEMAVVLGILAALLSMAIVPLSAQRDTANIRQARMQLADIEEALYGYAITQGALPCPTFPGLGGEALTGSSSCDRAGTKQFNGFVPYQSLGIKGQIDCYGLLLDPWGQPYRYSVSSSDYSADGEYDFVRSGEIKSEASAALNGLKDIVPNIKICGNSSVTCDSTTASKNLLANNIAAVAFSLGKHNQNLSDAETKNAGEVNESVSGDCSADNFGLSSDSYFYKPPDSEIAGSEFDDEFVWVSTSILYAKMLAAGLLP